MDTRTGLPIVGMIGAGQLARMTHQAAISLGQSLRILSASADDGAALVAHDVHIGDHTDLAAIRAFAKGCDVVTFDHEHVPAEHIDALAGEGVAVRPSGAALRHAQNKRVMRERLGALGLAMPRWAPIGSAEDLDRFGYPCVVKTVEGGYDGKGVFVADGPAAAAEPLATGVELIAEELVDLRRELAITVARSATGETVTYPLVETVQRDGVCTEVIAPAPNTSLQANAMAARIAIGVAEALDVTGVMTVELFETDGGLLVNELAMRPHNSAHWTIEGAGTSQFEQHVRAILGYPLGDTHATAPVTVMANVLGGDPDALGIDDRLRLLMAHDPAVSVHLYGKAERPGRKIGHVTVRGEELDPVYDRAKRAAAYLRYGRAEGVEGDV